MLIDKVTLLRALAAFVMAGLYVAIMARAAERLGSKIGGLLLALPSTILIGLSFITWQEGHDGLRQASAVLPTTIAAASIFLMAFVRLARWGLVVAYGGAVLIWLAITLPLATLHVRNVYATVTIGMLLLAIAAASFRRVPHRFARTAKPSLHRHALRFMVAGSVAAATVIVARGAGAVWAAVCSSFPAVFAASLYLMARSQGIEFTASMGRTMVMGNMANVVFVLVTYLFSSLAWVGRGRPRRIRICAALRLALVSVLHRPTGTSGVARIPTLGKRAVIAGARCVRTSVACWV